MTPEKTLRNLVLDTIYKMMRQKRSVGDIRRHLERQLPPVMERDLPPVTDEWVAQMCGELRTKELKYPEKMDRFRRRLGVA